VGISDLTLDMTSTTAVGSEPTGATYDSGVGEIFVNNYNSDNVSVLSDVTDQVVATIAVGINPQGVIYDSATGEVFVADHGSDTVSVISDATNTVVATVPVGVNPAHLAYDNATGEVFVANHGSNDVSVISDTTDTVVATVPAGFGARGVAYDPAKGEVFVTNRDSNNVSVISDSNDSVVATIPVGFDPIDVAYDPVLGEMFVVNTESANVSVISDSNNTVVATIPVGPYSFSAAYDAAQGLLFVTDSSCLYDYCTNSTGNVTVVSEATNAIVAVISSQSTTPGPTLTFKALRLPSGSSWSVSMGSPPVTLRDTTVGSVGRVVFPVSNRTLDYTITGPYGFGVARVVGPGNPSQTSDVIHGTTTLTVTFAPIFTLTFGEIGLPNGTTWSVSITSALPHGGPVGQNGSSSTSSLAFTVVKGTYNFHAATGASYSAHPGQGELRVSGTGATKLVVFRLVTAHVFLESYGLPVHHAWQVNITGPVSLSMASNKPLMKLSLPEGTYSFQVAPISGYTATPSSGTFVVTGPAATSVAIAWTLGPPPDQPAGVTPSSVVATGPTLGAYDTTLYLAGATITHPVSSATAHLGLTFRDVGFGFNAARA